MRIRPALRFKVLHRDRFTCRYCGRPAPTVILHVDHIVPRAAGGLTTLDNLVTACSDCNLGKAALMLDTPPPDLDPQRQAVVQLMGQLVDLEPDELPELTVLVSVGCDACGAPGIHYVNLSQHDRTGTTYVLGEPATIGQP